VKKKTCLATTWRNCADIKHTIHWVLHSSSLKFTVLPSNCFLSEVPLEWEEKTGGKYILKKATESINPHDEPK
jgi:hypothetical protein